MNYLHTSHHFHSLQDEDIQYNFYPSPFQSHFNEGEENKTRREQKKKINYEEMVKKDKEPRH